MPTLIPFDERNATRATAQVAIDASLSVETAKAAQLLSEARAAASRGSAALQAEALKADIEAQEKVTRAFSLQVTPLVSELLKHEQLEIAREVCSKYRTLQREAVQFCGRDFPLMPLVSVGQAVITRDPETKSRIARLGTVGGTDGFCAGIQVAAAHTALMSGNHDARGVRDALFVLERKLVEIARAAVPGDRTDEVWEAIKRGFTYYELDDLLRGFANAARHAAAASTNEHQAYVCAVRRGDPDALARANQTPGLIEAFKRLGADLFG